MKERVPLSFLLVQNKDEDPPVEPVVPFPAMYLEEPRICTAVLERTCVLASVGDRYDRITAPHHQVYVDEAALEWRTKTHDVDGMRLPHGKAKPGQLFRWHAPTSPQDVRAKTDEEALKNQQVVKEAKEREVQFLRRRTAEQAAEKKEESVIQHENSGSTAVVELPQSTLNSAVGSERVKRCRRCGEEKLASEFAATGIYGGYCATCEPIEKAERAAAREAGTLPKGKGGRRKAGSARQARRARQAKRATATNSTAEVAVPANGYQHVIDLLQRRDALKVELVKINQQLQEALA